MFYANSEEPAGRWQPSTHTNSRLPTREVGRAGSSSALARIACDVSAARTYTDARTARRYIHSKQQLTCTRARYNKRLLAARAAPARRRRGAAALQQQVRRALCGASSSTHAST